MHHPAHFAMYAQGSRSIGAAGPWLIRLLVLSLAVGLAASPARAEAADAKGVVPDTVESVVGLLAPSGPGGGGAPAQGELPREPSGEAGTLSHATCWGRTDEPHLSTHVPGTVAVHGRTWCDASVALVYVKTTLYRQDPHLGTVQMDSKPASCSNCTLAQVNAAGPCEPGTYLYYAYSNHIVDFHYPGDRSYLNTYNERWITC